MSVCEGRYSVCSKKNGDNPRERPVLVKVVKMVWTGASEVTERALP